MSPISYIPYLFALLLSPAQAIFTNGSVIAPCDSPIYCYGELLKQVELARPFSDSKTFVDMPATKPLDEVLAAFDALKKPLSNDTALNDFLNEYFADAGGELQEVPKKELQINPVFLDFIDDTVIREFTEKVIAIWPDLTRSYSGSAVPNCTDCPSSFIPIKRPFVIAGGRFREPYYWDSYWIIEGLLRTGGSFVELSRNIIENFLDYVECFGFVPNGGRIYYLNRSQPPVLSLMVKTYVEYTNDTSILDRALSLLVKEYEFFMANRAVKVTVDGKTYTLNHYAVDNNQPRPESYREDYVTATNTSYYSEDGTIYPQVNALDENQRGTLYSNLASGAESGWDFSSRWIANPEDAARDVYFPLRSLNTRSIVPVDLNSILYGNEMAISSFYDQTGDPDAAQMWSDMASNRSEAIHAVMWNEKYFSYFDYNLTSSSQNLYIPADEDSGNEPSQPDIPPGQQLYFNVAQLYPFWTGAALDGLKNSPKDVLRVYSRVSAYLDALPGGIPATNFHTGEQWDQPSVWPPLMHILMAGLLNVSPPSSNNNKNSTTAATGDVRSLALRLGQRYLDSTFCTWRATGGSTSETPQLVGFGPKDVGILFEKYSDKATNVAGGGGEYEVVEGFGWTNGVLIWTVDEFGNELKRPECGNLAAAKASGSDGAEDGGRSGRVRRAVELDVADARRVRRFGRRALD